MSASPYCTQQDLELRIGTEQLKNLTNDTWTATPSTLSVTARSGGTLSGTFYYVVTASGVKGETLKSNEVTFTSDSVNKTARLTWVAVATAVSYKVYKSSTSGVYSSPCLLSHLTALTLDDTGSVATLLTGAPPTDSSLPDATVVAALISKSDRDTDAKAGQVYTVPFIVPDNCTAIPSVVKQISIDCAIYHAFMRRYGNMKVPDEWKKAYEAAEKAREDISNQVLELDGNPTVASQEADFEAPTKQMDFNNPDSSLSMY